MPRFEALVPDVLEAEQWFGTRGAWAAMVVVSWLEKLKGKSDFERRELYRINGEDGSLEVYGLQGFPQVLYMQRDLEWIRIKDGDWIVRYGRFLYVVGEDEFRIKFHQIPD